jgi:hypothetical protein
MLTMKPKQAKKSKAPTFDLYDAVTLHSYRDPELFVEHFHLAGIDPAGFTLQEFCEAHSRLWDDAEIQKRMRAKIDAAPKLEFKVSEFMAQPWSSGYWRRALRDGFAYEVFSEVMAEMTEGEKSQLRTRIKGAVQ